MIHYSRERNALSNNGIEDFLKGNWMMVLLTIIIFGADMCVNYFLGRNVGPQYPMGITPPGSFFLIWPLIYLLLIVLICLWIFAPNIYQREWIGLNIVNLLNLSWVVVSVSSLNIRLYFAVIILFFLSSFCYDLWRLLASKSSENEISDIICSNVVALYLGWCVCASVLNLCQLLKYKFEVKEINLFITFCALSALLVIYFTKSAFFSHRPAVRSLGFYASASWGITGVLIAASRTLGPLKSHYQPLML